MKRSKETITTNTKIDSSLYFILFYQIWGTCVEELSVHDRKELYEFLLNGTFSYFYLRFLNGFSCFIQVHSNFNDKILKIYPFLAWMKTTILNEILYDLQLHVFSIVHSQVLNILRLC